MDAEFSVLGNAAKVKVSLTEFEAIVGHLLGVSKRAEVHQALKELVEEVRKSADTFMDVLSPLFALTTARQFSASSEKNLHNQLLFVLTVSRHYY